jgi:predicted  nucleic acid-binding Zn-ribbon protein
MREELKRLLQLQEMDDELLSLERAKVELPKRIQALEERIEETSQKFDDGKTALEELKREKRHSELELRDAEAGLKELQGKVYEIKTNKEYDALQSEIGSKKEEISNSEEEILTLMSQIEEMEEEIQKQEDEFTIISQENGAELESQRRELATLEEKIAIKQGERRNIMVRISQKTLSTYERISKGKNGLAVVRVRRGACGGCFKSLPPQKLQEIRREDRLITCENCGRILVWNQKN